MTITMNQTTFSFCPPDGKAVELEILAERGPLCVARVFDHRTREVVEDLYWIYVKQHGATFGPFFASLPMAITAMKKIITEFKAPIFEQPLEWIRRQSAMGEWLEKNIGKPKDLIGGEWRTS